MSMEPRAGMRQPFGRSFDQAQRDAKRAIVRTSDGMEIRGLIHIPPGTRTLDFMNRATDNFIAVTSATIIVGGRVEQANFVALNKAHITVLREVAEQE
jgi:hypothetical protein